MQDFKELEVYKKAYDLSVKIAKEIKDSQNFRLKGQLFGSITSVLILQKWLHLIQIHRRLVN